MENLILGTANIAQLKSTKIAERILNKAIQKGIYEFDTAPIYSKGLSEVILGNVLNSRKIILNKNRKLLINSKFGLYQVVDTKKYNTFSTKVICKYSYLKHKIHNKLKPNKRTSKDIASVNNPLNKINEAEINYINLEESLKKSLNRLDCNFLNSFLIHSKVIPDIKLYEKIDYLINQELFESSGWAGQFALHLPENFWKKSFKIMQTYHQPDEHFLEKLKRFLDQDNSRQVRIYGVFKTSPTIKDYLNTINKYSNLITKGYRIKHIIQRSSETNLEKTLNLYKDYFPN